MVPPISEYLAHRESLIPKIREILNPLHLTFDFDVVECEYEGVPQSEIQMNIYAPNGQPVEFVEFLLTNGEEVWVSPEEFPEAVLTDVRDVISNISAANSL